jgi:hypothetical protein
MREKTTKLDSFKERLGRLKKDKDSTIGRLAQMAFDLAQFGYEEEVVGLIEAHIMKVKSFAEFEEVAGGTRGSPESPESSESLRSPESLIIEGILLEFILVVSGLDD